MSDDGCEGVWSFHARLDRLFAEAEAEADSLAAAHDQRMAELRSAHE